MHRVGCLRQITLVIVEYQTSNERRPASPERLKQKRVGNGFMIKFNALIITEIVPESPCQLFPDHCLGLSQVLCKVSTKVQNRAKYIPGGSDNNRYPFATT